MGTQISRKRQSQASEAPLERTAHPFTLYAPWWNLEEMLSSLMAQMVKILPAMQETLGCEDPLEKGMSIHSSILAWRIL